MEGNDTPKQVVVEKMPGWQILEKIADEILETSEQLDPHRKHELIQDLSDQCWARIDEIIPDDELDKVTSKVFQASSVLFKQWPKTITGFLISQMGIARFYEVIGQTEDLELLEHNCGTPNCVFVGTKAIIDTLRETIEDEGQESRPPPDIIVVMGLPFGNPFGFPPDPRDSSNSRDPHDPKIN